MTAKSASEKQFEKEKVRKDERGIDTGADGNGDVISTLVACSVHG